MMTHAMDVDDHLVTCELCSGAFYFTHVDGTRYSFELRNGNKLMDAGSTSDPLKLLRSHILSCKG